jgi:molybdate transport system regulatory protein
MSSTTVKLRIDFGDSVAIGPGKIALLEQMRDTGSLSQAARKMKMSYRRAWELLESLNKSFHEPVIVTAVGGKGGGGCTLTPFGADLVAAYRALETSVNIEARQQLRTFSNKAAGHGSNVRRPLTKSLQTKPVRAAARRTRAST